MIFYSYLNYATHHDLLPFNVNVFLLALYLALVSIPLGLLPWLGSVSPKHPINSPFPVKQWDELLYES